MKNLLLGLISMTLSSMAFSQHLTDSGNSWLLTCVTWHKDVVITIQTKIDTDTIINSVQYKTLLRTDDAYNPVWSRVKYYLREDSEKRVFILDSMGHEGILYHFGLEPGQQVTLWNGIVVTIISIDTVVVANNQMQRRFHIKAQGGPSGEQCVTFRDWVDGIGGESGPLPITYCPDNSISYGLGCFYRNVSNLVWPTESAWCQVFVTGTTPVDESVFSVYPNPVVDVLNIQLTNAPDKMKIIQLYSLQGQMVYQKRTSDNYTQVDMSSMASGIFILKVMTADHDMLVKKIIKE